MSTSPARSARRSEARATKKTAEKPSRRRRPTTADVLVELARLLLDAMGDNDRRPSVLVRIDAIPTAPTEELCFGVKELDGHPADVLLGFVAPPAWRGIGVAGGGSARAFDDGGRVGRRRERVRSVLLVARDGTAVGGLQGTHPEDGRLINEVKVEDPARPSWGRIPDTLRRTLNLPTALPPQPPAALWAAIWLDRVRARAVAAAHSLSWEEVAAEHPAVSGFPGLGSGTHQLAPGRPIRTAELERAVRVDGEIHPWAVLRERCRMGRWTIGGLPAHAASWMDDSMFARWALGSVPDLHATIARVDELLTPVVARRVHHMLDGWKLATDHADAAPFPSDAATAEEEVS